MRRYSFQDRIFIASALKKERNVISKQKKTIEDLHAKQVAQLDNMKRLEEKLNNTSDVNTTVDKLLSTLSTDEIAIDDENQTKKTKIDKLSTDLIAKVNKSLAIEKREKSSWQSKYNKLENTSTSKIKVLNREIDSWSNKYHSQRDESFRMDQEISNLTGELDQKFRALQSKQSELEGERRKMEVTQNELSNLKRTSMQMKLTKDEAQRKLADLQTRYDADKRKAEESCSIM